MAEVRLLAKQCECWQLHYSDSLSAGEVGRRGDYGKGKEGFAIEDSAGGGVDSLDFTCSLASRIIGKVRLMGKYGVHDFRKWVLKCHHHAD